MRQTQSRWRQKNAEWSILCLAGGTIPAGSHRPCSTAAVVYVTERSCALGRAPRRSVPSGVVRHLQVRLTNKPLLWICHDEAAAALTCACIICPKVGGREFRRAGAAARRAATAGGRAAAAVTGRRRLQQRGLGIAGRPHQRVALHHHKHAMLFAGRSCRLQQSVIVHGGCHLLWMHAGRGESPVVTAHPSCRSSKRSLASLALCWIAMVAHSCLANMSHW